MDPRRIFIASLAAFLFSAGISTHSSSDGTAVSLGASAAAQPIACYYRCTGLDAVCRSACTESRGDCGHNGFAESLCLASYDACSHRCNAARTRCERECL